MDILRTTAAALFGFGLAGAGQAAGFDPRGDCAEILAGDEADRTMVAAWTFGYIAANTDNIRPVGAANNAILLGNLDAVCAANPGASLIALVAASRRPGSSGAAETPAAAPPPGSEAEARALLMRWFEPEADYRALTQAILPSEADVRSLYAEPLASALWNSLQGQMGTDTAFGPTPAQDDLLVVYTTTGALMERQPVLDKFPGGYVDVLQYFLQDVPIVRFKFVKAGEEMGLAFDGLVYLDGRWVIIPKPWRSLPG